MLVLHDQSFVRIIYHRLCEVILGGKLLIEILQFIGYLRPVWRHQLLLEQLFKVDLGKEGVS